MKQPPYTTAPLMGQSCKKGFSLRELLLGQKSTESYYEAHREDNAVYILWMEYARFGQLLAYPCVLQEEGKQPLVFLSGDSEANRVLLERWNELITPEAFGSFRCNPIRKDEFQRIYGAYRRGEAV